MEKILIIEDDELIAELERDYLEANGYETDLAFDGITGEQKAKTEKYDAILLDVMLPGKTGFDVCRELRKSLRLPIIMVTAKKEDIDKIRGLGLGADDYLVKPFDFEELLARIRCVTRRSPVLNAQPDVLSYHDIAWSCNKMCLTGPGGDTTLSKREGDLLESFLHTPEQILARETLLLKVWGPDTDVETGNLDNYVHFLRRRLKTVGSSLQIKTIRGVGYGLVTQNYD